MMSFAGSERRGVEGKWMGLETILGWVLVRLGKRGREGRESGKGDICTVYRFRWGSSSKRAGSRS